jgi:hypothetical protein
MEMEWFHWYLSAEQSFWGTGIVVWGIESNLDKVKQPASLDPALEVFLLRFKSLFAERGLNLLKGQSSADDGSIRTTEQNAHGPLLRRLCRCNGASQKKNLLRGGALVLLNSFALSEKDRVVSRGRGILMISFLI